MNSKNFTFLFYYSRLNTSEEPKTTNQIQVDENNDKLINQNLAGKSENKENDLPIQTEETNKERSPVVIEKSNLNEVLEGETVELFASFDSYPLTNGEF